MNCSESRRELDLMRESNSSALLGHLRRCVECRDYAEELRISRLLSTLPAPEPDADFEHRVLAAALPRRQGAGHRALRGWQLATAASLLLAVFLALPSKPQVVPEAQPVNVAVQPLSVSLDSVRALPGTLIQVSLPDNVQLDGYGDARELQWHTDLRAGANRLTLPVRALSSAEGAEILIRLEHDGSQKEFRVPVQFGTGKAAQGDAPQMI